MSHLVIKYISVGDRLAGAFINTLWTTDGIISVTYLGYGNASVHHVRLVTLAHTFFTKLDFVKTACMSRAIRRPSLFMMITMS